MNTTSSPAAEFISAVQGGDAAKVRQMLANDPSLSGAVDAGGVSAIMHAIYRRQTEVLPLLLASNNNLSIFEATATGRPERVSELLRHDPSLAQAWSPDGFTALHLAAFFGQEAIATTLLNNGADPAAVARNGMKVMPLHSAATARNLPVARALLERGAPPNARQEQGWAPLHSAVNNGDKAMVELLLKHGADPKAANDAGTTALQLATKGGHAEIVKLLQ